MNEGGRVMFKRMLTVVVLIVIASAVVAQEFPEALKETGKSTGMKGSGGPAQCLNDLDYRLGKLGEKDVFAAALHAQTVCVMERNDAPVKVEKRTQVDSQVKGAAEAADSSNLLLQAAQRASEKGYGTLVDYLADLCADDVVGPGDSARAATIRNLDHGSGTPSSPISLSDLRAEAKVAEDNRDPQHAIAVALAMYMIGRCTDERVNISGITDELKSAGRYAADNGQAKLQEEAAALAGAKPFGLSKSATASAIRALDLNTSKGNRRVFFYGSIAQGEAVALKVASSSFPKSGAVQTGMRGPESLLRLAVVDEGGAVKALETTKGWWWWNWSGSVTYNYSYSSWYYYPTYTAYVAPVTRWYPVTTWYTYYYWC